MMRAMWTSPRSISLALIVGAFGCGVTSFSVQNAWCAEAKASNQIETSGTTSVTDTLRQLEREWNDAIKARDGARASSFMADDYFLAVGRPGAPLGVFPKQQWLAVLTQYLIQDFTFGEMVVHAYGDTATVAYPYHQKPTSHGDDLTGDYVILDVWRKDGASWKVAARYSTRFNRTAAQNEQMGQPK